MVFTYKFILASFCIFVGILSTHIFVALSIVAQAVDIIPIVLSVGVLVGGLWLYRKETNERFEEFSRIDRKVAEKRSEKL